MRNARVLVGARVSRNRRGRKYSQYFPRKGRFDCTIRKMLHFCASEKSFQPRRGRPDGGRPQCVAARSRAPPSRCLAPAPRLAGALHAHARSRCSLALCHASPLRKHISPPGARTEHACEHSIIICVAQPHYIISLAASYYIARGSILYRSLASCDALRAPAVRSSRPRRRLKTFLVFGQKRNSFRI